MKVRAIDQFDNFKPGDELDLAPEYAKGVVEKGLAEFIDGEKAAAPTENKMADLLANKSKSGNKKQPD